MTRARVGLSWQSRRLAVFKRDGGICQACGFSVGKIWDAGHLIDRCVGGTDALKNLVLMCVRCNRTQKPITRTRREAMAWLAGMRMKDQLIAADDWRPGWEMQRRIFSS